MLKQELLSNTNFLEHLASLCMATIVACKGNLTMEQVEADLRSIDGENPHTWDELHTLTIKVLRRALEKLDR